MRSQFELLTTRRFLPFFLTQALGAFNDNIFKNSLMLLMAFTAASNLPVSTNILMNLAAGLFILPFFLFSASAGELADKMEKSKIIRCVKFAEILLMSLAAIALLYEQYMVLLGLLFLMGTQSAFFGPVKYAILPSLVKESELIGANAMVEMGTFVAILLGTIGAGLLMGLEQTLLAVSCVLIVTALLGYVTATNIPAIPVEQADQKWQWRPIRQTKKAMEICFSQRVIYLSVFAISWFWFLGAGYLTQFPNYAKTSLGGDSSVVTILLCAFTIGVAVGSMLCERFSGHKIELGIVPIGSIGLTVFGIDLYFATPAAVGDQILAAEAFFQQSYAWRVLIDLSLIGIFGGFFIVPLYALLQQKARPEERARVISSNNIFNALFMVASALSGVVLLGVMELSIPEYFLVLALFNAVVAVYVYSQMPEFMLRFVIWMLSHSMYRVTHKNLQHIPDEGAALLVCNHVTYVDALLLAGACRRPIRFVMDESIFRNPLLAWFFKIAKTIPICAKAKNEHTYENAFQRIKQELDAGNVVCIFPEGKLTKSGDINPFRKGVERILEETPVPVVPMAIQGLWGSFFSHHGNGIFKSGKRFWSKVRILADKPIAADKANVTLLQEKVQLLRGEQP
ncbi:MAG: MFS transporter [Aestuariibacter sp.]